LFVRFQRLDFPKRKSKLFFSKLITFQGLKKQIHQKKKRKKVKTMVKNRATKKELTRHPIKRTGNITFHDSTRIQLRVTDSAFMVTDRFNYQTGSAFQKGTFL